MNPMLKTDFYKVVHEKSYKEGLEYLTSYWTPRKSREKDVDKVVMFGLQGIIKESLIRDFEDNFFKRDKEEVLREYARVIKYTMGEDELDLSHIEALHDLGYLPIQIKAVKEGERVPIGVPMFEITNTVKGFGWLVNYLETYISCQIWQPITSATTANRFRRLSNRFYEKTVDKGERQVETACGDFSMRGMSSVESARRSAAGHLLSFTGTATIPSILYLEDNYKAKIEEEVVGLGTASMEHSVMSSYEREGEFESYVELLTKRFPKGNLSIVSDTYDYWRVLTEYLPRLKEVILAREGKTIIRGDSGDPVDIICGEKPAIEYKTKEDMQNDAIIEIIYKLKRVVKADGLYYKAEKRENAVEWLEPVTRWSGEEKPYVWVEIEKPVEIKGTVEILWDIFGGTINSKGYKVLNPKIGAIYGDSITYERAEKIFERLEEKGFSVSNVTLGIGSYTYQMVTRDTYGFALKATHAVIDGKEVQIYKEPKTDTGNFKKSQRGLCVVYEEEGTIKYKDGLNKQEVKDFEGNLLEVVFKDGELVKEYTLKEIRDTLNK